MSAEQILVRSKSIYELAPLASTGITHGRFLLVSAATVQNEIARRERNSQGNLHLKMLYQSLTSANNLVRSTV